MLLDNNYPLFVTYVLSVAFGTWPRLPSKVQNSNQINTDDYFRLKDIISWLMSYCCYLVWLVNAFAGQIYNIFQQLIQTSDPTTATKYSKYNEIVKKLVLAEEWTFSLTTLINMIITYTSIKHTPSIFASLNEIENWLQTIHAESSSKNIHQRRFLLYFWLVTSYSLIITAIIIEYSSILPTDKEMNFFSIFFQNTGKLCMMTFDLQFASLCGCLNSLFGIINEILKDIQKSHDILLPTFGHRDKFNKSNISSFPNRTVQMHELNTIHRKLSEIIRTIGRIYQVQITLNISVCFFNTVCVLFTTISEYRANTDWTLWISGVLWVAFYIIRVVMVCISADSVIQQINESKKYLSYINDKQLNKQQKYQVEHFLLRLTHTNTKFILCGLMKVDTSLLAAACLGILTYLAIALQYSYS